MCAYSDMTFIKSLTFFFFSVIQVIQAGCDLGSVLLWCVNVMVKGCDLGSALL